MQLIFTDGLHFFKNMKNSLVTISGKFFLRKQSINDKLKNLSYKIFQTK